MICGIIDLGSNTIRLSIYKYENGETSLLLSKKSIAGLLGYVEDGVLSPKGIVKTCSVLKNFRWILDSFGIEKSYLFATESLRRISNTEDVLRHIREETGFTAELLSGEEEATLDYYGVTNATDIRSGLIIDIGGGSTELVLFRDGIIKSAVSLPVGSLNLSLQCNTNVFPGEKNSKLIKKAVLEELGPVKKSKFEDERVVYGVGGTIRAARKIYNDLYDLPLDNMVMDADKFSKILLTYHEDKKRFLKRMLQLAPDRIYTVLTGMVILQTITAKLGISRIVVSSNGVREGYLYKKVIGGELT